MLLNERDSFFSLRALSCYPTWRNRCFSTSGIRFFSLHAIFFYPRLLHERFSTGDIFVPTHPAQLSVTEFLVLRNGMISADDYLTIKFDTAGFVKPNLADQHHTAVSDAGSFVLPSLWVTGQHPTLLFDAARLVLQNCRGPSYRLPTRIVPPDQHPTFLIHEDQHPTLHVLSD